MTFPRIATIAHRRRKMLGLFAGDPAPEEPVILFAQAWPATGNTSAVVRGTTGTNPFPSLVGANAPAWADVTAYVEQQVVSRNPGSGTTNYMCILAHTSLAALNAPGSGSDWQTYWLAVHPLEVVSAAGYAFWPTANALQVNLLNTLNGSQNMMTRQVSFLPGIDAGFLGGTAGSPTTIAVGESLYQRTYKRMVYADALTLGNNNHSLEDRSGSAPNKAFVFRTDPAGWNPVLNVYPSATAARFGLRSAGTPIYLDREVTYRIETATHRTGVDERMHEIRIYRHDAGDADGVLEYDTDDFENETGGAPLATHAAAFNASGSAPNGANAIAFLQMGSNGPHVVGSTVSVRPAWQFGAVAAAKNTWCGPYNALTG